MTNRKSIVFAKVFLDGATIAQAKAIQQVKQMEINGIDIEEYFRYHPPQTEERQKKHDAVNAAMLKYCQELLGWWSDPRVDVNSYKSKITHIARNICQDTLCLEWAEDAISKAYHASIARKPEAILMHVQQAQMFLNQGITIDELRTNQKPKPARKRDPWKLIHTELEVRGMTLEELELVDGCAIGLPEAAKLARVSGTSVQFWLNLWEAWADGQTQS